LKRDRLRDPPDDEAHDHSPEEPRRSRRGEPHELRRIERAVLAHVVLADDPRPAADALAELRALTEAAGVSVVGELQQRRRLPDRATSLGSGRVDELKRLAESVDASVIVFGSDLSPAQGVNLEKRLGLRVVDRSQLIMDLFAARARTHQARLQVELAQLQYSLPRLKRMWTHLDRYKGGIGMRGPGETQLELDRREIEKKIADRRRKIREIEQRHELRRVGRGDRFTVGLIGYTNAGKSTLFNRLTESDVVAEDRPFTTLDTKTSAWRVDAGCTVLLSDTIGFIRDLPHHLIASFHATLDEALHADLLLHVVDGSRPDATILIETVESVLVDLAAQERPRLLVVNKVDRAADRVLLGRFGADALHVSARTGAGLDELARRIGVAARAGHEEAWLRIPLREGAWLARLRADAEVLHTTYEDSCCILHVRAPKAIAGRLRRFATTRPVDGDPRSEE
jgi:GTP-binding protein HflX